MVDAVEVSVVPVLLGEGILLLPPKPSSERFGLKLASSKVLKTEMWRSSTNRPIHSTAWEVRSQKPSL
jgi:dihydrofolate reductase